MKRYVILWSGKAKETFNLIKLMAERNPKKTIGELDERTRTITKV